MAESDTPRGRTVSVFRILFICLFLTATVIKVAFLFLREDSDSQAQERMQESIRALEMLKDREDELAKLPGAIPSIRNSERETMQAVSSWLTTSADFLKQVRSGNYTSAYESTSSAFKRKKSLADFETMIRQHPEIMNVEECQVKGKVYYSGKGSELGGFNPKNSQCKTLIQIDIRKEGTWVVDLFEVEPLVK